MMLTLDISNLQHIKSLCIDFDLNASNIICITSKNGIGKTSIIKSLSLINDVNIIKKTSSDHAVKNDTEVNILINDDLLTYKVRNGDLDTKDVLDDSSFIHTELPIPHGDRFSSLPSLGHIDSELRRLHLTKKTIPASELVEFLKKIYPDDEKFHSMMAATIKGRKYYYIPTESNRYIREDHLSTGECFVINIFKILTSDSKLLVIDEIDVSLDSSAQISLMSAISDICEKNDKKVIFTTHSLVIMKSIYQKGVPILYLNNEKKNKSISWRSVSYGFIQLEMFGYHGYDKYIFTEDTTLESYINYKIGGLHKKRVKIVYIGGCGQVISILDRNNEDNFICNKNDALAILDGDSRESFKDHEMVEFSPFLDIEDEVLEKCKSQKFNLPPLEPTKTNMKSKTYYKKLKTNHGFTEEDIFKILEIGFENEANTFKNKIIEFINN